jgi:toxin YoeB
MRIAWSPEAWDDYVFWQTQDKKTIKRINLLLKEIVRCPFEGIGNPEPLKHQWSGMWSRRIDQENRLVYEVNEEFVFIAMCRGHYTRN